MVRGRATQLLVGLALASALSAGCRAKKPAAPGGATAAQDGAAAAQPAGEESRFALTIYSHADPAGFEPLQSQAQQDVQYRPHALPGYGVVRERRNLQLQAGENTIRFTDVAAGIDPTTVLFKSLTAPDSTFVQEQNFEYDLTTVRLVLGVRFGFSRFYRVGSRQC